MEDIEHLIKIVQQKRLVNQHELDRLDVEPNEHRTLMKELQDLRQERTQCMENITKHLSMITSHKHSVHKIVHSMKDVSGLPVPHDYAQEITTMFNDTIEFLNNIHKTFTNVKEDNVDSLKLIQSVTMCLEAIGNKLDENKCSIVQLETLKENITALQQCILDNSDTIEDESFQMFN